MDLKKQFWYLLLWLPLHHMGVLAAVSTITQFGNDWPHSCVQYCLGQWPMLYTNLGAALSCGTPFYDACYCATATASASVATSFLSACASTSCSAGDFSQDLSAMHSIYASNCMQNGFTQPGAINWYNPATTTSDTPTTTSTGSSLTSGPSSTTTQLTLVTKTAVSSSGAMGTLSTQPQITIQTTSTVWVSPDGSAIPGPSPNSNTSKLALEVGLGVGIPIVLIAAGFGIWICVRARRRSRLGPTAPTEQASGKSPSVTAPQILRKPAPSRVNPASPTAELGGRRVRRELAGEDRHQFPDDSAEHEMNTERDHAELSARSRSPPPVYSHTLDSAVDNHERSELP